MGRMDAVLGGEATWVGMLGRRRGRVFRVLLVGLLGMNLWGLVITLILLRIRLQVGRTFPEFSG